MNFADIIKAQVENAKYGEIKVMKLRLFHMAHENVISMDEYKAAMAVIDERVEELDEELREEIRRDMAILARTWNDAILHATMEKYGTQF